jgi:FtsZ-interacting cell division protein ZipA
MSDLQISLLIIGAAVICGVYLFNWQQQRRFRRTFEEAFDAGREDALLESGKASAERLEPQLASAGDEPARQEAHAASPSAGRDGLVGDKAPEAVEIAGLDAEIDYVAGIDADAPIPGAAVDELLARIAACGKPWRGAGFRAESGEWEELVRGSGNRYQRLRLGVQLVNRAGAIKGPQLAMFCDAVRSCAERIGARASCPDVQSALARARELDALCAEVDVAIGVNIVAPDGRTFAGSKIRALAEAAGFTLEPDGVFHFHGDQRQTLFTLDNHEPAPFLPEQIRNISTGGVTLLLDVPRVADGLNVFDRMLGIARSLSQSLGGRLVDDNRVALNEAGIAKIRQQLAQIYATMEAGGMRPGSARALRVFT